MDHEEKVRAAGTKKDIEFLSCPLTAIPKPGEPVPLMTSEELIEAGKKYGLEIKPHERDTFIAEVFYPSDAPVVLYYYVWDRKCRIVTKIERSKVKERVSSDERVELKNTTIISYDSINRPLFIIKSIKLENREDEYRDIVTFLYNDEGGNHLVIAAHSGWGVEIRTLGEYLAGSIRESP